MKITNKCLNCGKETVNKNYCSRKCFNINRITSVEKECNICKKIFSVEQNELNTKKYCSNKCRIEGLKVPLINKTCNYCNKEYKVEKSKLDKRKFCSEKCQHDNIRGVKTSVWVDKKCIICEKEFKVTESDEKYGRGKFCSKKCAGNNLKKLYKDDGNPMFGKKHSKERKLQLSSMMSETWKTKKHREKFNTALKKFIEEHGYYPGTDKNSKKKKR